MKTTAFLAGFWSRVDRRGPDDCWEWTGARSNHGYGAWTVDTKLTGAHRASWLLHHGSIPDGLMVLHRCDNKPCVNPAHLFLGTASDNARDMVSKGRHVYTLPMLKGEKHPAARLTEKDVREIRARLAAGEVHTSIAARFHVCKATITHIHTGRLWGWLDAA